MPPKSAAQKKVEAQAKAIAEREALLKAKENELAELRKQIELAVADKVQHQTPKSKIFNKWRFLLTVIIRNSCKCSAVDAVRESRNYLCL